MICHVNVKFLQECAFIYDKRFHCVFSSFLVVYFMATNSPYPHETLFLYVTSVSAKPYMTGVDVAWPNIIETLTVLTVS